MHILFLSNKYYNYSISRVDSENLVRLHEKFCNLLSNQTSIRILNLAESTTTKIPALKLNLTLVDKESALGLTSNIDKNNNEKGGQRSTGTFCNCSPVSRDFRSYQLQSNHFAVCKPDTRSSLNYLITVDFVNAIIRSINV